MLLCTQQWQTLGMETHSGSTKSQISECAFKMTPLSIGLENSVQEPSLETHT